MTLGRFVLLGPPRSYSVVLVNSLRFTSAGPPPSVPAKPGSISDRYDKFISRWPKVQAIHRMVVDGSRWCFTDIKTYFRVRRELREGKKLSELSCAELETLVQTPVEAPRLAVVLTLLPLPFTVYVIGFAIIFFPRLILTRHFWSDQQRKEFFLADIDKSMATASNNQLFSQPPSTSSSVGSAPYDSVIAVSRLHGMLPFPGVQRRLDNRAKSLKELDRILAATLDALTPQQLYFHMYIRRLSYTHLSEKEIREKLRSWLSFSSNLTGFAYLMAPFYANKQ